MSMMMPLSLTNAGGKPIGETSGGQGDAVPAIPPSF